MYLGSSMLLITGMFGFNKCFTLSHLIYIPFVLFDYLFLNELWVFLLFHYSVIPLYELGSYAVFYFSFSSYSRDYNLLPELLNV